MTLDEYLVKTYTYFSEIGSPVFIHGSTLLGMVRNGKLLQRIDRDNELNFGCLAEDVTPDILKRIYDDHPYVMFLCDEYKNNHLIYFGLEWEREYSSPWNINPGFTLLAPFHKEGNSRYEHMGNHLIKVWDADQIDDSSTWNQVRYNNCVYKTPKNYEAWFDSYYGSDWREEQIGWHWLRDAKNLHNINYLYPAKPIIKKHS